ncbi:MAG: hypothetical protein V9E81_07810 [Marmoricola sp.]
MRHDQLESGELEYLPGIEIPPAIMATHDHEQALKGADFMVLAVPSQTLRANLTEWAPAVDSKTVFVSLMKGVEPGTVKRMSEVIAEVTNAGPERLAVVSGPNLAKEIARREPAASVVACADEDAARELQAISHTRAFGPTPPPMSSAAKWAAPIRTWWAFGGNRGWLGFR